MCDIILSMRVSFVACTGWVLMIIFFIEYPVLLRVGYRMPGTYVYVCLAFLFFSFKPFACACFVKIISTVFFFKCCCCCCIFTGIWGLLVDDATALCLYPCRRVANDSHPPDRVSFAFPRKI